MKNHNSNVPVLIHIAFRIHGFVMETKIVLMVVTKIQLCVRYKLVLIVRFYIGYILMYLLFNLKFQKPK